MATEIGSITALIGMATATAVDGSVRQLLVGDKVYQNDIITTGTAGAIEIEFNDGSVMDLGRSSQAVLDLEVYDPSAIDESSVADAALLDDIDAIQQALLAGEDPTQIADPTAAGGEDGPLSEGGSDALVIRDYLNPEEVPQNGFDTTGPSNGFDYLMITPSDNRYGFLSDDDGLLPPIVDPNPPVIPNAPVGLSSIQPLSFSEANLAHGTAPDSSALTKPGSFTVSAPDGLQTLTVGGETIVQNGEVALNLPVITDSAGNTLTIIDITTDGNGNYTVNYEYTLNGAEAQPGDNSEKTFEIIAEDVDGDRASGTLDVNIIDDKPLVISTQPVLDLTNPTVVSGLILNERFLADGDSSTQATASLDVSQFFTTNYGADGVGSTTYALEINTNVDSGLIDTVTGDTVLLRFKDGDPTTGIVEGYVVGGDGESIVFSLSIDQNGLVNIEQFRAVYHDDPTDPIQSLSPATFNNGVINVVLAITDGDGDASSAKIDLGVIIGFTDDGPSAEDYTADKVISGETITGQFDITPGADGAGITHINGEALLFNPADGWSNYIKTDYGYIRVTESGEYEYLADPGITALSKETVSLTVTDGDGDFVDFNAYFEVEKGSVVLLREPPVADPILTSFEYASAAEVDLPAGAVVFKKFTVGGGVDAEEYGEILPTVHEATPTFGGQDTHTAEADLIFTLKYPPTTGTLYKLEENGSLTEINVSDTFKFGDTLYWVATENDLNTVEYSQGKGWKGVELSATNLDGSDGRITYQSDGIGVAGGTHVPNQLEYRDGKSQEIKMSFGRTVTQAEVAISKLIASEKEVGRVDAYLNGALVGSWTFTNASGDAKLQDGTLIDFTPKNGLMNNSTFKLPEGVIFDELVFSAEEYVLGTNLNTTDSSDYFIQSVTVSDLPASQLAYSVTDEDGMESEIAVVAINHDGTVESIPPLPSPEPDPGPLLLRAAPVALSLTAADIDDSAAETFLVGQEGQDIFVWHDGDQGTVDAPAIDTVTGFDAREDVLDISDLLQGEESGDITDFIEVIESGNDVVINLTPNGDGDMTQTIKLQDTSFNDLGVGGFDVATQQAQIIQTLINNGQINVDQS